jgi:hypothetical protein
VETKKQKSSGAHQAKRKSKNLSPRKREKQNSEDILIISTKSNNGHDGDELRFFIYTAKMSEVKNKTHPTVT